MTTLLDELKEYLRIDGDEEDTTLSSFIFAAQDFLKDAGVKQPKDYYLIVDGKDVFARHRLAIMMLATHWYENRTIYANGNTKNEVPYGVQTLILQLKWVNPDEFSVQQQSC